VQLELFRSSATAAKCGNNGSIVTFVGFSSLKTYAIATTKID
jgi:hypothetical protein